jgi:hypothetical protein
MTASLMTVVFWFLFAGLPCSRKYKQFSRWGGSLPIWQLQLIAFFAPV